MFIPCTPERPTLEGPPSAASECTETCGRWYPRHALETEYTAQTIKNIQTSTNRKKHAMSLHSPSSVKSTLIMKNMNPLAPSFWPPTSVFTHPEERQSASMNPWTQHSRELKYIWIQASILQFKCYVWFLSHKLLKILLSVLSFGHLKQNLSFLTNSLTFSFELRQKTPWTLMSDQMAQIMTGIWFVVLLKVWDGEGHV